KSLAERNLAYLPAVGSAAHQSQESGNFPDNLAQSRTRWHVLLASPSTAGTPPARPASPSTVMTIRGDEDCLRHALRVVRKLYGSTPAGDFGPKALKACRQHMIGLDWSRTYINAQVDRVRRMFRWAAEEELFPKAAEIYHRLETVTGLRK